MNIFGSITDSVNKFIPMKEYSGFNLLGGSGGNNGGFGGLLQPLNNLTGGIGDTVGGLTGGITDFLSGNWLIYLAIGAGIVLLILIIK